MPLLQILVGIWKTPLSQILVGLPISIGTDYQLLWPFSEGKGQWNASISIILDTVVVKSPRVTTQGGRTEQDGVHGGQSS